MRASVSSKTLSDAPYELWNAYIGLLAEADYDDLSVEQRPAHLVFWYESEVQNGGHFQYFENQGVARLDETIAALGTLGATGHREILAQAKARIMSKPRRPVETVEEFCAGALEGEFDDLDAAFHKSKPNLVDILQRHLDANVDLFVEIKEDK